MSGVSTINIISKDCVNEASWIFSQGCWNHLVMIYTYSLQLIMISMICKVTAYWSRPMILQNNDKPSGLFLKFMYSISVSNYGVLHTLRWLLWNIGQSDSSKDALIGSKFEMIALRLLLDCTSPISMCMIIGPACHKIDRYGRYFMIVICTYVPSEIRKGSEENNTFTIHPL